MRVVTYYTSVSGAPVKRHTYDELWGVFAESAARFDLPITLLSAGTTPVRFDHDHDSMHMPGIDPQPIMLARERAYKAFLEANDESTELFLFAEIDSAFLAPPPDFPDADLVILRRPSKHSIPLGVRYARPAAVPLFQKVTDRMHALNAGHQMWHGDVIEWHRALGVKEGMPKFKGNNLAPGDRVIDGVRVTITDSTPFGIDWPGEPATYMVQFKGTAKLKKLALYKAQFTAKVRR